MAAKAAYAHCRSAKTSHIAMAAARIAAMTTAIAMAIEIRRREAAAAVIADAKQKRKRNFFRAVCS